MTAILDIDLLRTFQAVARLGRFRAAAEFVSRSPAAVSIHIQRLESIAGGRLLNRDNQSVTLTALGRRLLSGTSEVLAAHDRVIDEIQGKALAGRLILGIPDEYAAHVIRDILPDFASEWPNLILEVKTAPSLRLRSQVERGKLDVAIVVQPESRSAAADILTMTTPVWVGSRNFMVDDAVPLPLALYREPCPYRAAMIDALEATGRGWRAVLESASTQVIRASVESGLAATLLDRGRVSTEMRILDSLPQVPSHEVRLIRANRLRTTDAMELLVTTLRRGFRG
jgi:DNA-binding transcriptional LysR family regulator